MPGTRIQRRAFVPPFVSSLAREVDQLQANIRRMFEHPLAAPDEALAFPQPIGWLPAVEITETDGELAMTVELPGLDRKDVHVDLDGDVLTLRGEKREERKEEDEKKHYHLEERSYGAFLRSFVLPPSVVKEKITADYDKGVLTLHLPKTAEVKPAGRKIPVGDGKK
jgi:HSP20 family protein